MYRWHLLKVYLYIADKYIMVTSTVANQNGLAPPTKHVPKNESQGWNDGYCVAIANSQGE
jgi:hypothetical protein